MVSHLVRRATAAAIAGTTLLMAPIALSESLLDIYEIALDNDAQLRAETAQYRADLELKTLALAPLLPQVNTGVSRSMRDSENTRLSIVDFDNGNVVIADQTTGSRTYTTRYDISLSQTLFDLSAWFDWKAGSERSKQAEATVAAAQQNLIVRVSEAYFGVLRAQDNLRAAKAQERALARQLEQTRQRFNVGLIAITDVYEAEARHDLAGVTRIVEENNVAVALERLSVLTGQQHGQLQLLSDEFTPELPMPTDRSAWVDFALENNYELAAVRFAEEAARQNAKSRQMGHAPRVSAQVSYSESDTTGTVTPPNAFNLPPNSEGEDESFQIRLDMPLYAGGAISANRRRAAEQFNAARENRINLTRNTITASRSLHMTVSSDVARVKARKQAIKSTQSALDATVAGYEVGTRNIVDVLNAQNAVFAAQRDYANSRYDYVLNSMRLKENAGTLSPEDIAALEAYLEEPEAASASEEG
ncbi:type I secretion outer membrane protein, TolC family [gamma proteobacterium HIMB55]|nr:type I secretion outer membrane protein, TolC family [gamma proteobacterium HIMB55]